MEKHRYEVKLVVEVEAFDRLDAEDKISEALGPGDLCGVEVVQTEVGKQL